MERRNTSVVITVAIVVLFFFIIDPFGLFKPKQQLSAPKAPESEISVLKSAFEQNAQPPDQYLIGLFKTHNIVFLGEMGRIKQEVDFVAGLIPELYKAGIHNLGIEYALASDQTKIDRLLTEPTYNEKGVEQVLFDRMVIWGFKEYADLFHAAWKFNQSLTKGQKPFRIVGLSVRQEYQYLKKRDDATNPAIIKKVLANGIPDVFMAQVIEKQFIDQGEKALIYTTMDHVFTTYENKQYAKRSKAAGISNTLRAGNIIYDKIGAKAFSVALHSPWPDQKGINGINYPVGGVIDALINALPAGSQSGGLTLSDNALGKLPVRDEVYASGYKNLTLSDMFNGYIVLGPISRYESVAPIPDFINSQNLSRAIKDFPGPNIDPSTTAQDLNKFIANMCKNLNIALKKFH